MGKEVQRRRIFGTSKIVVMYHLLIDYAGNRKKISKSISKKNCGDRLNQFAGAKFIYELLTIF